MHMLVRASACALALTLLLGAGQDVTGVDIHAAHLDADAPKILNVDGPDEARADDGGAEVGDPCHEVAHPLVVPWVV